MASKKKLRKRIESLKIELNALRASNNSLHQDLRVVLEGKDKNRILQIRIRTQIEDDFENAAWNGKATRIGNGFFHQIQNCSEYEEMNQAHANKVSDFLSDFKKPKDALHDEKFKYEELEKRTCQPTQVNPENDGYSMLNKDIESPKIEKRGPIIEMLPKTQKEIEADAYMNKDFIGGYNPNAKKPQPNWENSEILINNSGDKLSIGDCVELFPDPGGQPLKIKSFFIDSDAAFPGIMALTESGKSYNIDYLTPINKTDGLKEEEEKKEGTVPE